jgi:putative ABC transport system permease protein
MRLGAIGIAIALPIIWALGRLVESQLFGVKVADPGTATAAVVILLVVVFGAGAVPAWRISRVSPLEAFRVD